MSTYVDIGHGVSIEIRHVAGETEPAGVAYKHPDGKGGTCEGWAPFKSHNPEKGWDVQGLVPLTISPSLLCRICGNHGFIRNGVWVPA